MVIGCYYYTHIVYLMLRQFMHKQNLVKYIVCKCLYTFMSSVGYTFILMLFLINVDLNEYIRFKYTYLQMNMLIIQFAIDSVRQYMYRIRFFLQEAIQQYNSID